MDNIRGGQRRVGWQDYGAGTTSASVTQAAAAGKVHALKTLVYSTDKSKAVLTITGGSETIYHTLDDSNQSLQIMGALRFEPGIEAAEGSALTVTLTGTADVSLTAIGETYG